MAKINITVLGAGSWGTALAILLARNGHNTKLWGHQTDHIRVLEKTRRNDRYLPGIELPENLRVLSEIADAMEDSHIILIAVPSHAFNQTIQAIGPHVKPHCKIAWATKGIDPKSGYLLHRIANDNLPFPTSLAVISGPTFALEVANNLPTAITVASPQPDFARELADILHNPRFRVYTANDIIGVQIGGAVKNVLAIATGVADGLGFGANTRSALVTRGLTEMIRIGLAVGGEQDTFMGLTGLGDLILSCTDDQSRNRRFGLALGKGQGFDQAVNEIGQEIEGISAAREIHLLAEEHQIELPISEQVYEMIYENNSPEQAVNNLLSRTRKPENS